jgi:hypothetical protein
MGSPDGLNCRILSWVPRSPRRTGRGAPRPCPASTLSRLLRCTPGRHRRCPARMPSAPSGDPSPGGRSEPIGQGRSRALRQHLIDERGDAPGRRGKSTAAGVAVTGSSRTLAAIQRMVPAHAAALNGRNGWSIAAAPAPDGVLLTATARPQGSQHIRGLIYRARSAARITSRTIWRWPRRDSPIPIKGSGRPAFAPACAVRAAGRFANCTSDPDTVGVRPGSRGRRLRFASVGYRNRCVVLPVDDLPFGKPAPATGAIGRHKHSPVAPRRSG